VNRVLAQKLPEGMGATLALAADGQEVLAALERARFDLVLMDCQMPGMDGFEATARIRARERERGGHLPIVAMTANALGGDREHCLARGMDDYLAKPVTRQALFDVLTRWSGKAQGAPAPAAAPPAGSAPRPATDEPALDQERFGELEAAFHDDADAFHARLLGPYLAVTGEQLRAIDRAVEAGDTAALLAVAHKLKGASRTLGFVAMGEHAHGLEVGAREGDARDRLARAAALREEFQRVVAFAERRRKARNA
jgi:two-component system, sensor histidine kinase and response regulator